MAYVTPSPVSSGDVATAAAHNIIVNDIIDHETRINSYASVYTNEAARDAAITSPTEGMQVYLTAPTVPTATGTITAIPTGIRTVYNGSVWVCVTPVGASSNTGGTITSSSFLGTLTGDGTAISVTLVTGTTAEIHFSFSGAVNAATEYGQRMDFAVSGATTRAADNVSAIYAQSYTANANTSGSKSQIFTGLTAGTNTFTLQYRAAGGTATFSNRQLLVKGVA
jgi:hypothetical protein